MAARPQDGDCMQMAFVVLLGLWLGVAAVVRQRAASGPVHDEESMPPETAGELEWTRPTLADVEGWLALAVLTALTLLMATSDGPTPVRGLALVAGFLLVHVHDARSTRRTRRRRVRD